MKNPTTEELAYLADQQAHARSRYAEDDSGLIRESRVIEWALRHCAALRAYAPSSRPVPMAVLEGQIERLRKNDFAGMETMRTFALGIIDDLLTPSTAMTAGRCEDCPPVGYPTAKTRCAPCDRRSVADDMAASIRTAESMLSAHIEEFHDFDYQPHEVPAELQQLRSIQHHLLGSLIDETGEIYPSLSAPVAPAAPVAGAPDQWQDIAHEARFLLDRLEELDDANDKEYVREFEGHVRPPMSRLRRLLPRNDRWTPSPEPRDEWDESFDAMTDAINEGRP